MKMCEASKESELHGRMRLARYSFKRGLCFCMYTNAQDKEKMQMNEKKERSRKKTPEMDTELLMAGP